MSKVNKLLYALFAIVILYSSASVYGYNLWYRATAADPTNSGNPAFDIVTLTDAYEGVSPTGGWVWTGDDPYDINGGTNWFKSSYYIFYNDQPNGTTSRYSTSNDGGHEIYYDVHSGAIDTPGVYAAVDNLDLSSYYWGQHAWVTRLVDTAAYPDYYYYVCKNDTSRVVNTWQLVTGGNKTDVSVYRLQPTLVNELLQKFGTNLTDETKGIRFSSALNTTFNTYMDTAGLFYDETIPRGWSVNGQGMDGNRNYIPGKSVANEYDNWLTIPVPRTVKREVYVNHVDEAGNVIPGIENFMVYMGSGSIMTSYDPKMGFQEHYTVAKNQSINVTKSYNPTSNGVTYTYLGGKEASGATLVEAKSRIGGSTITFNTDSRTVTTNTNNIDDVLVINLIYRGSAPSVQPTVPLQLTGRLEFINKIDSAYTGSTSSHTTDYIPSTKQETPYAQDAYPYVVRGIRYQTRQTTGSPTATITISIDYSWQYWRFEHHDVEVCEDSTDSAGNTTTSCHDECTSSCKYYSYTGRSSRSKSFTYNVPYKYTYFDITNFKMYRISKLEVYDNNNNVGGTLFGGGTYTVNPSSTYESRFNNSRGKIDNTLSISFPSSSYALSSIYKSASSPGSGQSAASTAATAALNAVTEQIAANHQSLTISYQYDNDYVELDGATDMLQRNYKSWSEPIRQTTNSQRDLDATKTGTGRTNGSALAYTSNLMNYMKPSNRLTTNNDFAPNYQTVPANRENGLRTLAGKVYYNITRDSKYNVGSDTFTSTDQTYRLNNSYGVSSAYLTEQTKDYKSREVNDVNVLTPLSYDDFQLITVRKVDHTTTNAGNNVAILQKNADFTITPKTAGTNVAGYNLSDTREFVKGYYFTFDFDVLYNGRQVTAGTPIYRAGANATFTGKTTDSYGSGSAAQLTNSVTIVAVTTNITGSLTNTFNRAISPSGYIDYLKTRTRDTGRQNQSGLLTRNDIVSDAYHAIYKNIVTKNVGRIFDFAVTDCTDLAFKDVFRKPNATNVNESTGVSYYSGYKKWNLDSTQYNEMINRTDIGSSPQKILPLGPYKNTNTSYVNSPKMGYRISFDLKTTGYIANNNSDNSRTVEITPKYYYISKDGKTFDNNIKLYYKNSTGKYVTFAGSGYTIYYKPNDGYRYLRNSIYTNYYGLMSTKLEPLTISSKLVLTNKMMSSNNTSFIQAWYGEFKLPNSTIAISNNASSPNSNVNNSYKDGYIGVIFDIKSIDSGSGGFTLSYDTSDKSASSQINTSQWDYEGFMNFSTPGSAAGTLRYQLEKDVWLIDNARYQQIKGTVVLFDLDNRAANDFE